MENTLRSAYSSKNWDLVRELVEQGANVASEDKILIHALEDHQFELAELLVKHGANIHIHDDWAVCKVAAEGPLRTLQFFVEHGANIHTNDDAPLCYACIHGNIELVNYLVDQGCDIHAKGGCALFCAAYDGHLGVVQYLIWKGIKDLFLGYQSLYMAARNGHWGVVRFLEERVDVTFTFEEYIEILKNSVNMFLYLLRKDELSFRAAIVVDRLFIVTNMIKGNVLVDPNNPVDGEWKDSRYYDSNLGMLVCSYLD